MEDFLMTDEQFQVYNSLVNFTNQLIDNQPEEKQKELKKQLADILANNKPIKH